jgi:hypothetical protein
MALRTGTGEGYKSAASFFETVRATRWSEFSKGLRMAKWTIGTVGGSGLGRKLDAIADCAF